MAEKRLSRRGWTRRSTSCVRLIPPLNYPRVAILAPLKEWGGLERKFGILCEEFMRQGVEPAIVRLRSGGAPLPRSMPASVQVVELATRSKLDGIPRVADYLRAEQPDALLTAKDHSAQVAIIARRLARVEVPLFIKTTNMPSEVLRRPLQRFMARRLYHRADGVIAISQGVAKDVEKNFGVPSSRISLIYNPAVTRDFDRRCRASISHTWLTEGGIPVVLAAGRMTPQKDFALLIEAFARLRAERPCRLVILGDGKQRSVLEAQVDSLRLGEHVSLPGAVDDPVPYMRAASLFAFSSRYEGLGNVLIEALAAGTRIVATDCPSGPREILGDGRYGHLVPVGNSEALAAAMARALQEPRPSAHQVDAACARFRAEDVAAEYLRVMGLSGAPVQLKA